MTQNTSYSGSMSNDRRDPNDNQPSEEIRADIDQTRQAVGSKIDQLQARLDPNKLKAQAQESVQEMISDTANSVTDYVRSHRDELVGSVADAARRNPLPTALVGLGIGWLLLESMAGGKDRDDDRWEYERRNFSPRSRHQGGYPAGYQGSMRRDRRGYDYSSEYYTDTADQQFAGNYSGDYTGDYTDEYVNYTPGSFPIDSERDGGHAVGNGKRHGNPLAKAAGTVKETLGDVTDEIKDRVSDAGQEIKERMEDVKDRMGGTRDRIDDTRYRMDERVGGMRRQAEEMRGRGERQLQRAGYRMEELQSRARYEGRRRGQQFIRNLEDNPLTYGALALAAGAALAILLPQTRTENRYFGETRDELMERGEEFFDTARERAQQVASEMRPELEEKARKLVDDAKEMGKEIAQEAKEELRPVLDKAVDRTKEEARTTAQEVKSGSSTSGSSTTSTAMSGTATVGSTTATQPDKMVINRDTMRGQWNQIKGEVKSKWGKLTDDDLTRIEGDYDKLLGALQTSYGYNRGRAEQELSDYFKSRGK